MFKNEYILFMLNYTICLRIFVNTTFVIRKTDIDIYQFTYQLY